jgi:hypothetical protein
MSRKSDCRIAAPNAEIAAMKTIVPASLLAGSIVLWLPLAAHAQPTVGSERASILVGSFVSDRETNARLDSDSGDGTDIDLEDDLGLDSSMSVGRIGGYLWLGRRHRFDAAYFDMSRDASRVIDETIEFGDEVFPINTTLESEQNLSILKADYTFAALARDRGYLGIVAGLYIADMSMTLSERTLGSYESEDVTAPLPLFGLRGDYAITDRITLRGAMQWFGFETDDIDGRLTDFYLGADYGLGQSRRMAIGLAYDRVSMNIGSEDDDGFDGRLDWGYDGLLLYFKADFGSRAE